MTATKETHMTTQISTKLAALAVALMMNSLIIGGVAYSVQRPAAPARGHHLAGPGRRAPPRERLGLSPPMVVSAFW